jgi:hypothetical protein
MHGLFAQKLSPFDHVMPFVPYATRLASGFTFNSPHLHISSPWQASSPSRRTPILSTEFTQVAQGTLADAINARHSENPVALSVEHVVHGPSQV